MWPDYQPVADGIQNARSVLIDERFQQLWPDFLKRCGLRERGESQNDILDALKGDGQELSKFVENCRNTVTGGKNTAAEPSAWEKRIKSFVHQNHEEAIRNERKAINEAAQKWVKSIQDQILE
ncbi:MAG: hypothetical protein ACKPKO_49080, partial [Candidatus Fonsibacter sp.]